jgi:hypothetical protein
LVGAHESEGRGEVNRSHGFVQAIVGFDEVLATHGGALVGESLAELKEAALAGASGLVAKFGVADLGEMNEAGEFFGDLVAIEFLERE